MTRWRALSDNNFERLWRLSFVHERPQLVCGEIERFVAAPRV